MLFYNDEWSQLTWKHVANTSIESPPSYKKRNSVLDSLLMRMLRIFGKHYFHPIRFGDVINVLTWYIQFFLIFVSALNHGHSNGTWLNSSPSTRPTIHHTLDLTGYKWGVEININERRVVINLLSWTLRFTDCCRMYLENIVRVYISVWYNFHKLTEHCIELFKML